jgi:soluble lytic murein transglycosylase
MVNLENLRARIKAVFFWLAWGLLLPVVLVLVAWGSNSFWDALSPITHKKQLYQLAGEYKIDPLLLASIIKTESGFNPYASSKKGALGLMQLVPATAEAMAAELKIDYQDQEDLYREDVNLRLGTHYFSKLLKANNGHLVLTLAAYNAGPTKVKSWSLDSYGKEQDDLIAGIPVVETRNYVKRVIKTYRFFKTLQAVKRMLRGDVAL